MGRTMITAAVVRTLLWRDLRGKGVLRGAHAHVRRLGEGHSISRPASHPAGFTAVSV